MIPPCPKKSLNPQKRMRKKKMLEKTPRMLKTNCKLSPILFNLAFSLLLVMGKKHKVFQLYHPVVFFCRHQMHLSKQSYFYIPGHLTQESDGIKCRVMRSTQGNHSSWFAASYTGKGTQTASYRFSRVCDKVSVSDSVLTHNKMFSEIFL